MTDQPNTTITPSDDDTIEWGAQAIARLINTTPRRVYWLAKKKAIPVENVGGRLAGSRKAILARFRGTGTA